MHVHVGFRGLVVEDIYQSCIQDFFYGGGREVYAENLPLTS